MKQKFKINKKLGSAPHLQAGKTVSLEVRNGVPTDRFWRRRLKDAAVDGCIEPVTETKKKVS